MPILSVDSFEPHTPFLSWSTPLVGTSFSLVSHRTGYWPALAGISSLEDTLKNPAGIRQCTPSPNDERDEAGGPQQP